MLFKRIPQVAAPEWKTWVEDNDAVILDVREPMEWARGTLEGSRKVQLAKGFENVANLTGGLRALGMAV